MNYGNILEEELKNKIAKDLFPKLDCTRIIGKVDFCVSPQITELELFEAESYLWAEAKRGQSNIYYSITQLILTIGKARTFDNYLPPSFLGAFDSEKIAFIPYNKIQSIFYKNDFNWTVAPSNYETKEFKLINSLIKAIIDEKTLCYYYDKDLSELKNFIQSNFNTGKSNLSKISIDKNNFIGVYSKWLKDVMPTISCNWVMAKKKGIIDGDFYLADLISEDSKTLKEALFVQLKDDHYELDRKIDDLGMSSTTTAVFSDNQIAHKHFWNRYERPPAEEYWEYIVQRRDLLVPQDVRERKGSFFTPQKWVQLSQKYIADVFGVDWQSEYYIWDCAAGTGNLLIGLTNKYNVWASTLDVQDVEVMKDRIENGANLLESHVFQFDFLNDSFDKLPDGLKEIIVSPEKRERLIIYINPPYAEAASSKTVTGNAENKTNVSNTSMVYNKYSTEMGKACRELFTLFFIRIYKEIPGSKIAEFSKLKILQATNFKEFRDIFQARLQKMFMVPAFTFDNVTGNFPIGFFIWDTKEKETIHDYITDVFDEDGHFLFKKKVFVQNDVRTINDWLKNYIREGDELVTMCCIGADFQHQNYVNINYKDHLKGVGNAKGIAKFNITKFNLKVACIYFAVRKCIEATWMNDRDLFLFPGNEWKDDEEFINDCFIYTIYNLNIQIKNGTNNFIPFSEEEVNAKDSFTSHFLSDYIQGKLKVDASADMFPEFNLAIPSKPMKLSDEATMVQSFGKELWQYYHSYKNVNTNATYYDIREYFQGRNDKGKMNKESMDHEYAKIVKNLRYSLKILSKKISEKAILYSFLQDTII